MATKSLNNETNTVVDYIRQNTKDKNEWVHIRSRDMNPKFSISQLYFAKIIEKLKDNPHILYEVDENFPSRFKPYRFRWTENPQEKIDHGLTHMQFYWLDANEIEYIKNIAATNKYDELSMILKTCNLLAGDGGRDWWIDINQEELADLTASVTKEIKQRIGFMISKKLLVKAKHNPYYRLVLNPDNMSKVLDEAKQATVQVKPKQERKKRKPEAFFKPSFSEDISSLKFISDTTTSKTESAVTDKLSQCDVPSNNNFQSDWVSTDNNLEFLSINSAIQDAQSAEQSAINAANKLKTLIQRLVYFQKQEEGLVRSHDSLKATSQQQEEELIRGHDSFQKLLVEYETLRSEHDSLKEAFQVADNKNKELQHQIKLFNKYNEDFITNAQASMDILLGVMTSVLDEYIMRPKYEQNDVLLKSRLTKAIFSAVTDVSDRIVSFKPESKLPPDLR